jgi:hypothetical protein
MSLATSRKLCFAGLGVLVIGGGLSFNDFALAHVLGLSYEVSGPIYDGSLWISFLLVAIAWLGAMVKMARLNQWLWLALIILFGPLGLLIYLFAGPTTPARTLPVLATYARAEQIPPDALKGGIFVSYRREDSADICGRIYDHLSARYGKLKVFKDVDNIPYGADFPTYIQARLRECAVCLAVIGPKWLTSASAAGQRRLDDPGDFVRLEIEGALQQGLAVIPVVVYGAGLPPAEALPTSLGQLPFLNAAPVRLDPDFATDVRRLCDSIDRLVLRPTVA